MKYLKFVLVAAVVLAGCQKAEEEEVVDLDQMVMAEEEINSHLSGDPLETPQEEMIDFSNSKSSSLTELP